MTVQDLGLCRQAPYTSSLVGFLISEDEAARDVRLVWTTEYEDMQESFTVTISYRGWRKGFGGLTAWSSPVTVTLPASQCHPVTPLEGGRVWWSHDLDIGGILSRVTSGSSWSYSSRVYDSTDFQVSVYSNFTSDFAEWWGSATSNVASAECLSVGFRPNYSITSVYYERSDLVVVEYATTWTRMDDRYCFEPATCYDVSTGRRLTREKVWGTVAARGRIELPTSELRQHVKGRTVSLDVRFNPTYRPIDWEFSHARWQGVVGDKTTCNTPKLSVVPSADPYAIAVQATDSGSGGGTACEYATVKLANGKYAADEVTVPIGGTATLRFPPLNEIVSVEAVGSTSLGATSALAFLNTRRSVNAGGICVIDSIADSTKRAVLKWNGKADVSSSGDFETVKLAGRRRPSAFYGSGGTTRVSVSGALIDEDGRDLEEIPEAGDVMVRLSDGRRYALAAEVSESWGYDTACRVREVTISGDEVDA